ncbi:hypothetical protein HYU19_04005 [Candidatus Woesearchaeota archaeon]|nr:hypothetical protein [Candidatus Woesearchaeota archaeon]
MVRKRWKRKSGYGTPAPTISKKELLNHDFFLNPLYNDWDDWRDGFRDWYRNFKAIKNVQLKKGKHLNEEIIKKRLRMNQKQERLLKRRKAKMVNFH